MVVPQNAHREAAPSPLAQVSRLYSGSSSLAGRSNSESMSSGSGTLAIASERAAFELFAPFRPRVAPSAPDGCLPAYRQRPYGPAKVLLLCWFPVRLFVVRRSKVVHEVSITECGFYTVRAQLVPAKLAQDALDNVTGSSRLSPKPRNSKRPKNRQRLAGYTAFEKMSVGPGRAVENLDSAGPSSPTTGLRDHHSLSTVSQFKMAHRRRSNRREEGLCPSRNYRIFSWGLIRGRSPRFPACTPGPRSFAPQNRGERPRARPQVYWVDRGSRSHSANPPI
jgi:hypothetical protein